MEGLETSQVYKCLERKTRILGFEVADLFVLSLSFCALNLVFAGADLKMLYTFGPVAALGLLLRAMKGGRADNFLLHWIRFHVTPGVYRAWPLAASPNRLAQLRTKGPRDARFYLGRSP